MLWPGETVEADESTTIEECWADLDGGRMRYLHAGTGPALILVHGLLGYSFSWRFALPALAPYASVYAVDMLGAGFSDRCPGLDCGFLAGAKRLLEFADSVGLDSFDLLGTSHGGAVALTTAGMSRRSSSFPEVNRLVLVAPVNPWSQHGKSLAKFLSRPVVSMLFCEIAPHASSLHNRVLQRLYGDVSKIRSGTLAGYEAPLTLPGSFEYALQILSTWGSDLGQLEAELHNVVDIPTLLIWGSLDRAVNPDSARTLCRYFRDCQVVQMEGVGHLPYEEAPEDFNKIVINFLTDN